MSEQTMFSIGKLLTGSEGRDAIHFAVAPVTAGETVYPGQHVAVENGERIVANGKAATGIVDPFLKGPVYEGQRCWLFLYPNTITALRHNWTHPAFPATPTSTMSESENWLREYAEKWGFGYEHLLDAAKAFVRSDGDYDQGLRYDTDLDSEMWSTRADFWRHFQAVTGQAVPEDMKDRIIFWCSC
jgi:hypothetical protein